MSEEQPAKTAAAPPVAGKHASPFITDGYRNALDRLNRAFTERLPLAILTGDDHAGRSYIIDSFLDGIEDDVTVAHITGPDEDAIDGMRKLVQALGFDSNNLKLADIKDIIEMFLSLQKLHDRRTVIRIDEAQDYGRWVLDEIYRLVELEKDGQFGLVVILTGGAGLNEVVSTAPLSAISANAGLCIALAPFTLAETMEYIRLYVEGGDHAHGGPVFEADAITIIHDLAQGMPDAISLVCSKCLLVAEKKQAARVSAAIVIGATQQAGLAGTSQSRNVPSVPVAADGSENANGRLIMRKDGQFVAEQSLSGGELQLGRDARCEIRLKDMAVSRRHAKLVSSSDGVELTDLGSRNGTLVNGRKIKQYKLQDGDTITIGECTLEYVAGSKGQARETGISL